MKYTVQELQKIGAAGAGFSVDGRSHTAQELQKIAMAVKSGGGQLVVRHAEQFTTQELQKIAVAGQGHVSLDLDGTE